MGTSIAGRTWSSAKLFVKEWLGLIKNDAPLLSHNILQTLSGLRANIIDLARFEHIFIISKNEGSKIL